MAHLLKSLRDCWKKFEDIEHIILRLRPISLNNSNNTASKLNNLKNKEKTPSESVNELFIR